MKIIKTSLIVLIFSGVFGFTQAQNNTYPWIQTGNIGIGTSTPAYKLHINGEIGITAGQKILLEGGGDIFSFIAYDDGNIGGFTGATVLGATNGKFAFINGEDMGEVFTIDGGVASVSYKLTVGGVTTTKLGTHTFGVNGSAIFTKAYVKAYANWPDYVFEDKYHLMPIPELEKFVKANKHLPGVPKATEVEKDGIDLGDNQTILLKKVEELTLYVIEQNKKIEILEKQNEQLKKMQEQLDHLKKLIVAK